MPEPVRCARCGQPILELLDRLPVVYYPNEHRMDYVHRQGCRQPQARPAQEE